MLLRFRLLPLAIEIEVDDPATAQRLRYVTNSVQQIGVPILETHRWRVRGTGPWSLEENGDRVGRYERADNLLFVLYQRCYGRLAEQLALGGWLSIHGGLARISGRRVLVVGQKGVGKTTLMMRLLADGRAVEGDEQVLVRDGIAVALPRAFHVKPGTAALIPELAGALRRAPRTALSDGTPIIGFDPTTAGFAASTAPGPIDLTVVLRRTGADADVRALSTVATLQAMIEHALPFEDARARTVSACATLLGAMEGFEVQVGDPAATAELIAGVARGTSRSAPDRLR